MIVVEVLFGAAIGALIVALVMGIIISPGVIKSYLKERIIYVPERNAIDGMYGLVRFAGVAWVLGLAIYFLIQLL